MTSVTNEMDRWVDATPAGSGSDVLTPGQIAAWQQQGFALVSNMFRPSLIDTLRQAAIKRFPAAGSAAAQHVSDFGSDLCFPSSLAALNDLTLDERLLSSVSALLQTPVEALRLSQSDLWPKYGRTEKSAAALDNMDQRIHIDYPNHTLAHPTEWFRPEAVEMIVYLSDVESCGGPTAVVPREGDADPAYRWPIVDSPGIGELDYVNDRATAETYFSEQRPALTKWRESLYKRERYTRFKAGDVLFYRHDTWHRGTPMIPGTLRLVQNITYRRAECEWVSTLHPGWAWSAYRKSKFLERLIAKASLAQRAVLGFPQPGSSYWSEATLAAVEARYSPFGMDMTPYQLLATVR
ncbi:MAG: phytanoyl-CoA dioxygenase family protein [Pseudomonadaceae bacterium]|nr:phytanoyl-CoA dioxygenase family protein [Pseudomonadaceae bacterium]